MSSSAVRHAVEEANAQFARCLDTRDYGGLRDVFTTDAVYHSGGSSRRGVEEIVRSFRERDVGERRTRHLCGGLTVLESDAASARTVSVWTSFAAHSPDSDFGVYVVADFVDEWARTANGRWRLASRVVAPVFRDARFAPRGVAATNDDPTTGVAARGPARTTVPARDDLTPEQQVLYTAIVEGPRRSQRDHVPLTDASGGLLGPFGLMLISPSVGSRVQELGAVLRFGSHLTDRARELLVLDVAVRLHCEFEWSAHEGAARSVGVSPTQLEGLLAGELPDTLGAEERCVLELGRAVASSSTSDHQVDRAVALLGLPAVADVVWTVGYYSMLAWALDAFRPAHSSAEPGGRT